MTVVIVVVIIVPTFSSKSSMVPMSCQISDNALRGLVRSVGKVFLDGIRQQIGIGFHVGDDSRGVILFHALFRLFLVDGVLILVDGVVHVFNIYSRIGRLIDYLQES